MATAPRIYAYFNIRQFFSDWLIWKQQQNPSYTLGMLARRSARAPATLSNILSGRRRLTAPVWRDAAGGMGLAAPERAFGEKLVALSEAADFDARCQALQAIFDDPEFVRSRRLEQAYQLYASRWYYVAIRELALLEGFVPEPAWLVRRLRYRITEEQASEALDTLLGLGLLRKTPDGLVSGALRVQSGEEAVGEAFFAHHREMIRLAGEALEGVDPDLRYFGSATFAIPIGQVEAVRNGLVHAIKTLLNSLERPEELDDEPGWAEARDTVFQLNAQLFPLTRLPGEDEG